MKRIAFGLLPCVVLVSCDLVPRSNEQATAPAAPPALAVDSAQLWRPLELAHLDDNVKHDTLLIQTTFRLGDSSYVMVASNVEETREGLRLVLYRPRPDSSADVIAMSKPGYDSRTMLPTFFRGPAPAAGLLVLANMGERDSWGQEVFLLKDGRFLELGFLNVAVPTWEQREEGPVRRLQSVAPNAVVTGPVNDLSIAFQGDSLLLYDDLRGHQEVSLAPARVRYRIKEGKAVLVLDGEALTATPL